MTRSPRLALSWLLGRRWLRARAVRQAAVIALVGAAVISGIFIAAASFVPSASQQADTALGTASNGTYASFELGQLHRQDLQRLDRAVRAVAPTGHTFLESRTLRPDTYAKGYFQSPTAVLRYFEDGTAETTARGRYSIVGGRAPVEAGEVAVTRHLAEQLGDPRSFTVLSGSSRFRVVGVVRDAEARLDDEIMAAPGTWANLRPRDADHQYQPTEAQVEIRWSGAVSAADIASAMRQAVPGKVGAALFSTIVLSSNTTTRSSILSAPARPFGSDQVVVSYGPFSLIVLLLAMVLLSAVRRPMREIRDRLALLGIPVSHAVAPLTAVLLGVIAIAAGVGVATGILVMVLIRPLVLQPLADETLSPLPAPSVEMVLIALSGLLLIAVGLAWPTRSSDARSSVSRFRSMVSPSILRRSIAAAAGLLVLVAVARSNTAAPYLALAAVLLMTPDLLWVLLRVARSTSPRLLVVRRLAHASHAVYSTAIVALGACLAIPLAIAGQATSSLANDASFRFSAIPIGQIWIAQSGDVGDISGVADALRRVPSLPLPIPVSDTKGAPGANVAAGPVARVTPAATGGLGTMVLPTIRDARLLLGASLSSAGAAALSRGGIVNFNRPRGPLSFAVYADGGKLQRRTSKILTVDARVDRGITLSWGGAMLASTARALHLPISPPRMYVYAGISRADIRPAVAAAVAAGYDGEFVQYRVAPPAPKLPPATGVFTIGLVLAALALILLVVRLQAASLRASSSRLSALGLSARWIRSTLYLSVALVLGSGAVGGAVAGALSASVLRVPVAPADLPIEASGFIAVLIAVVAGVTARASVPGFDSPSALDM